jgi:hypothetical protein
MTKLFDVSPKVQKGRHRLDVRLAPTYRASGVLLPGQLVTRVPESFIRDESLPAGAYVVVKTGARVIVRGVSVKSGGLVVRDARAKSRLLANALLKEKAENRRLKRQLAEARGASSGVLAETADAAWAELIAQGEVAKACWVTSGKLIGSTHLAQDWDRTRQALDQACARNELFFVRVGRNKFYPSVFASLEADLVGRVCRKLIGDAVGKFVFWNQQHGGLNGRTPEEAIKAGHVAKVVQLAEAWSAERGRSAL